MIKDAERIRQRQQTLVLTDRAVLLHQPAQPSMYALLMLWVLWKVLTELVLFCINRLHNVAH